MQLLTIFRKGIAMSKTIGITRLGIVLRSRRKWTPEEYAARKARKVAKRQAAKKVTKGTQSEKPTEMAEFFRI